MNTNNICRLEARRKAADQRAYDKLVEDVTGTEAKSRMHSQYLPTMKLQLGQGVHIAITMGLGYALGSQFGGALSTVNPIMVRPAFAVTCNRLQITSDCTANASPLVPRSTHPHMLTQQCGMDSCGSRGSLSPKPATVTGTCRIRSVSRC